MLISFGYIENILIGLYQGVEGRGGRDHYVSPCLRALTRPFWDENNILDELFEKQMCLS